MRGRAPEGGLSAPAATGGDVTEAVLRNGLKVLIREYGIAPVVSFMVWYKVGSRNEARGMTGDRICSST